MRDVAEGEQHPINRQFAYHLLSEAHVGLGEYETAEEFAQQAYAQSLMTGDRWFRAYILNNMGQIAVALGDNRMGKMHFQSSYEIRHDFADPEGDGASAGKSGQVGFPGAQWPRPKSILASVAPSIKTSTTWAAWLPPIGGWVGFV